MISPKVKAVFFFCLALTFGVLIFGGYAINKEKPPIPAKVLDHSGSTLFTGEDVIGGQNYSCRLAAATGMTKRIESPAAVAAHYAVSCAKKCATGQIGATQRRSTLS